MIDFPTLLRILPIAMQLIESATDPTTPTGQLAQEIRQLLFRHQTQLAQMAVMHPLMKGAYGTPPAQPPSLEHLKTPEDVLHFIRSRPTTDVSDSGLPGSA
jgi:hypothetical protein